MTGALRAIAGGADNQQERGALLHWEQVRERLPKGLSGDWSKWKVRQVMKEVGTVRFGRVNYVYEADLVAYLAKLPTTGPGKGGHPEER